MNGDEDLGEDITMKGDKFHFIQKPAQYVQFATGMNGDEDLGEDITMKGDKFHFVQGESHDVGQLNMTYHVWELTDAETTHPNYPRSEIAHPHNGGSVSFVQLDRQYRNHGVDEKGMYEDVQDFV